MAFFKRELSPVERFESTLKEKQAARARLADRLSATEAALEEKRAAAERLAVAHEGLRSALATGAPLPAAGELLHNDLQRAAVSLRPEIAETLRLAVRAGGERTLLSGSGPTVLGLFSKAGEEGLGLARLAAAGLAEQLPEPLCARPVDGAFGRVVAVEPGDRRAG